MKSNSQSLYLSVFIIFLRLIRDDLLLTSFLLLLIGGVLGQNRSEQDMLKQKALLFKNRVEYDSAIFYYRQLDEILKLAGNEKEGVFNDINIYDIYVLQRDFIQAHSGLDKIAAFIATRYPGDIELQADFLQVKGSYLFATGENDSAKHYLLRSIRLRASKFGANDTLLHYANNKLGNLYLAESDYDSAFFYHHTALEFALHKQNPVNFLAASSYQNLGIAAHKKGDFQLAEDCYLKSLNQKEKLFVDKDPALAKIYWNLGKFYSDLSKYNIALKYYDKAEQLLISRYDRNNIQFANVYWNKGNVYTHNGDFVKATNYLTKAYSILEMNLGTDDQDVSKVLLDLGFAYNKKGDNLLAIEYYNKAAKNKDNSGIIKIYRNLGNIYQEINEPDSAEKYYHLSIDFAKNIYAGTSFDLALCYQYYGEFLVKSDRENESIWYYAQASEIFIKLFGIKNNKDLSKVYRLQSEYFLLKAEYDSAVNKIQEALIAFLPGFSEKDPSKNPEIKDIILDIYIQDDLQIKALALYKKFRQSNNLEYLIFSLETINLTLKVTEEIRKTYNEEESQLILNNNARNVIDLGVMVTYRLFTETNNISYLAEAFHFSEKGQAIILLSALRGLEAQSNTYIPEGARDFEKNLTENLATYNNMIYQEKQKKSPDEAKIKLWSNEIFNLGISHDSILDSYKQLYPEYFRLKYDYSIISADSALRSLAADQAILEYYLNHTDSLVIGFLLTDGKLSAQILGNNNNLMRKLDSLHMNFVRTDYFNAGQKEFESLTSISADLYDILIRPFENEIAGKRLIIIPDGELGYLSFDLLLRITPPGHSGTYNDLPWLIKSNPISYSSSATIYFEQTSQASRKVPGNLLAFAPSYNFKSADRDAGTIDSAMLNLSPMVGTKEEINSISGLFRTKKMFDEKATETYFKEHAGEYGILHLAMHTIIDNKNPLYSKLVFTRSGTGAQDDGYLNTYELFGIQLPGQLAVLSACNTGSGKLERGEGIISLARGFFYAGIPSVVMTLWEIEDYSSAELVALFYENLKKGLSNDVALQEAKITYLERAGKMQSHPYFWAGYVNIGKTEPIRFKPAWTPVNIVIVCFALIVLITIIYFFINRRVYFRKKRY
jgi:CHAT domain-containing protein/Tfp pilus assembly protein PilF